MKNISAFALFVAATLITAGSALAEDNQVKATVPFKFTVGASTLPAGTYTISSKASAPDVLAIRGSEKNAHVLTLGLPGQSNPEHADKLVFHKYGDQYFLSEIRTEGSSMNIHFSTTKAEKRAKAQAEEARLRVNDPVMIALN